MNHPHHHHSGSPGPNNSQLRRLTIGVAAGTISALIVLSSLIASSAAAAVGNGTVDPSALKPPVPAFSNAGCSRVGNHVSCAFAFDDPEVVVDAPSGIICGGTELLLSQTRSVVGERRYDADANLLQRHFRESLNGTFTNPETGLAASWTQHDTVIHNLSVPGDDTSGTEHVSGLFTRAWLPGGGTIINDAGTMITDTDGNPLSLSGQHPFLDFFVFGDTTALDSLCAALD